VPRVKERIVSIIRVTRIGELGITLAVTSNRSTLLCYNILYCILLRFLQEPHGVTPQNTEFIVHSYRCENLKFYTALNNWLCNGDVMSPVRYKLGFYFPDDILHSHRRENLKSYIALTGWAL
jgi:hypothetical protein